MAIWLRRRISISEFVLFGFLIFYRRMHLKHLRLMADKLLVVETFLLQHEAMYYSLSSPTICCIHFATEKIIRRWRKHADDISLMLL